MHRKDVKKMIDETNKRARRLKDDHRKAENGILIRSRWLPPIRKPTLSKDNEANLYNVLPTTSSVNSVRNCHTFLPKLLYHWALPNDSSVHSILSPNSISTKFSPKIDIVSSFHFSHYSVYVELSHCGFSVHFSEN